VTVGIVTIRIVSIRIVSIRIVTVGIVTIRTVSGSVMGSRGVRVAVAIDAFVMAFHLARRRRGSRVGILRRSVPLLGEAARGAQDKERRNSPGEDRLIGPHGNNLSVGDS